MDVVDCSLVLSMSRGHFMVMSNAPAIAAAKMSGIMARRGSINVYCTTAAGAMQSAGPIPEKKTSAPSFLSMVMANGSMPVGLSAFLSCMRVLSTSMGEDTNVALQ